MTEVQSRKMISTEIQERQILLAARVQYYRDLGIFDFYRRGEPLENAASLENAALSALSDETQTPNSSDFEEQDISVRKPFPLAPAIAGIVEPALRAQALNVIRQDIGDCTRCALAAGRNKIVFGDGSPNARLLFVGEGPGADEDAQGLPFVGRAGQLLNNMINAMGLSREQVYIANIVKCRPPGNRVPEPEEAHTCTQFLFRQIDVIRPEVIVALGSTAATYLLGGKSPLNALRGRVHSVRGAGLIVTYHPAFLLRDPRQKKEAWKDLQIAMAELGLSPPAREQSTQTP
jgi:uracil-DNA glycosylase family 4